jgi:[protein-PII] uridylyltransferase
MIGVRRRVRKFLKKPVTTARSVAERASDAELRAALSGFAHDLPADGARRATLELLKSVWADGKAQARRALEGGAPGVEVARKLADSADRVVAALWDFATTHVVRARNPTEGERLSLVAVGGYGRGVLAPHSDLDLLFLRAWKETPHTQSLTEWLLYALWDMGFKVGWASRTVDESLKAARDDHTIRTALLEARPLTGDEKLFAELRRRFLKEVVRPDHAGFVEAKLAEREARHAKAGASRYLVEPNVKDGKGGLRDLHALYWIAQDLEPPETPGPRLALPILTPREARAFGKAYDFLWSVRLWLHFLRGRPEERLTFDLQPEVARRMGFPDRGESPGVERFMRRYFVTAKEVGALTRAFCAKLELEQRVRPRTLSRVFQIGRPKRKLEEPGFVEDGGRLNVEGEKVFRRDPANLLRLFRLADRHDLDLHPDAFALVNRNLDLIDLKTRKSAAAAEAFLDVLARGARAERTLSLMNDTGVLGRYLPEFGRVVARMQFNMYHAFTVDEHTLRAVGVIHAIKAGELVDEHPLASVQIHRIEDQEALFLAMLLHDVGKGGTAGQEKDGAVAARRACERLGLSRERGDLVAWLVEHHLVFSDYAQKRDVSDPETVAAFARIVGDPERLRMLLVVTVADVRAVGPGVWNGWKGRLMRELYAAAEAVFRGGRDADPATVFRRDQALWAAAKREELAALGPDHAAFARDMEDAWFVGLTEDERREQADLAIAATRTGRPAARLGPGPELKASAITVAAADRRGLFADLAATLAALGADVVGARVFTSRTGQALDAFYVQDAAGRPFASDDPVLQTRACRALERAAEGAPLALDGARREGGRGAAFAVSPMVSVDPDASESATVVEVSGRDRPGLLADLARALSGARLSIQSAHVQNFGERATDVFYVVDEEGRKVVDHRRLFALRSAVLRALEPPRTEAGGGGLRRARASLAR